MKEEYNNCKLIDNSTDHRFEMRTDHYIAVIEYTRNPSRITLIYTRVMSCIEGIGMATTMIEKTLEYIEQNQLKLIPICPLVVAYLKRNPEWKRIVYKDIQSL